MSRLLTRLVERSRGELETVRPRLPGRFEDMPEPEPDHEAVDAPGEDALSPGGARAQPPEDDRDRRDTTPTLPRKVAVEPGSPPPAAAPAGPPAPVRETARSSPDARPAPGLDLPPPSLPRLPGPASLPTEPTSVPRARPMPDEPTRGTLEVAPDAAAPPEPSSSRTALIARPSSIDEVVPLPPTLAEPEVVAVDVTPREGTEPPVIEVRIGRIEVQAAAPSPPTRRAPRERRGPQVALDDYLRRRREG